MSSLNPNDFPCSFYHHCCKIIGEDVVAALKYFFVTSWLHLDLNSNFMVQIPKTLNTNTVENLAPIMLDSLLYKIINKLIFDCLASIFARIVSYNQFGFIKGRHIEDCNVAASYSINLLNRKGFGGNVTFKIDIRKAFDTLSRSFLINILKAFGFFD